MPPLVWINLAWCDPDHSLRVHLASKMCLRLTFQPGYNLWSCKKCSRANLASAVRLAFFTSLLFNTAFERSMAYWDLLILQWLLRSIISVFKILTFAFLHRSSFWKVTSQLSLSTVTFGRSLIINSYPGKPSRNSVHPKYHWQGQSSDCEG